MHLRRSCKSAGTYMMMRPRKGVRMNLGVMQLLRAGWLLCLPDAGEAPDMMLCFSTIFPFSLKLEISPILRWTEDRVELEF